MIRRKNGFTLFELLISISIIGILTALAVISYSAVQRKARDAKRMEDMLSLQKAAEQVYSLNSYNYPLSLSVAQFTAGGVAVLGNIPTDPKGVGFTQYSNYNPTASSSRYCFCAAMENTSGGNSPTNDCTSFVSGRYYCVRQQQ